MPSPIGPDFLARPSEPLALTQSAFSSFTLASYRCNLANPFRKLAIVSGFAVSDGNTPIAISISLSDATPGGRLCNTCVFLNRLYSCLNRLTSSSEPHIFLINSPASATLPEDNSAVILLASVSYWLARLLELTALTTDSFTNFSAGAVSTTSGFLACCNSINLI